MKDVTNKHFWNAETARFIACVNREGVRYDFGYTFVNLEAISSGLANAEHTRSIPDRAKIHVEGETPGDFSVDRKKRELVTNPSTTKGKIVPSMVRLRDGSKFVFTKRR